MNKPAIDLWKGFPGGSDGNQSAWNVGDPGSFPGLGRSPGEGHGNTLQYSCLENPHWQRSLTGYSPWGCKESDMTEWLSTHTELWKRTIYCFHWILTHKRTGTEPLCGVANLLLLLAPAPKLYLFCIHLEEMKMNNDHEILKDMANYK